MSIPKASETKLPAKAGVHLPPRWQLGVFLASFLGTLLVHLAVRAKAGIYPFGSDSGAVGDFSNQYYPFYQRFRDALVGGSGLSDFGFSWTAGLGMSIFPDYATYLGGPWTFLVLLFPAQNLLLAMTVIVLLKASLAAGTMRLLIARLRPTLRGAVPLVLSVGYGSTSWIFEQGVIIPQWLDAVYGVPLLCLVALEMRKPRSRWILSGVAVGIVWWSNYYVAFMASLVAGIFAIVLAVGIDRVRAGLRNVVRFAGVGVLGVLLAAPFLLPVARTLYLGVGIVDHDNLNVASRTEVAVRFLPYTFDVYTSPQVYSGLLAVFLCAAFIFTRDLRPRFKIAWIVGSVLIMASLVSKPLSIVWNAFQTPHGSMYRWTFVVTAWLVITAALAVETGAPFKGAGREHVNTSRTNWVQIGAVAMMVALSVLLLMRPIASTTLKLGSRRAIAVLIVVVGVALILRLFVARREGGWIAVRRIVGAGIVGVTAVELILTGAFVVFNQHAGAFGEIDFSAAVEAKALREAAQEAENAWPTYRLPRAEVPDSIWWARETLNARFLYPSTDNYSTAVSEDYVRPLEGIGMIPDAGGRTMHAPVDSILEGVLGVTRNTNLPVLPVTRLYSDEGTKPEDQPEAFANRALLADATDLYEFPPVEIRSDEQVQTLTNGSAATLDPGAHMLITACKPGTTLFVAPFQYDDIARPDQQAYEVSGSNGVDASDNGLIGEIGVAKTPVQSITLILDRPQELGKTLQLGCADMEAFHEGVATVKQPDSVSIEPGIVRAEFESATSGQLVVATPLLDGWTCHVDGIGQMPSDRAGLLALNLSKATSVECHYTQPLLKLGVAIGAASLMCLIGLAAWQSARRRSA